MLTGRKTWLKRLIVGKTQKLNYFLIDRSWYIVDLPGYGYENIKRSAKNGNE